MADAPALTVAEQGFLRGVHPSSDHGITIAQWKLRLKAPQAKALWDVRSGRAWLVDHDGEYLDGPKAMYPSAFEFVFGPDHGLPAYRVYPTAQILRAEYELRREAMVQLPEYRNVEVREWEAKLRQAEALDARARWPEP